MTLDFPVLTSGLLATAAGVRHGFFTRAGGVSQGLYASLNLGRGSGDDPASVAENRARAAARFGLGAEALAICHQIHSADVVIAEAPWGEARPRGDAVVSAAPGVICGALAADCAPVLIAEPEARIIAAVHAGWRGALAGVVESAVAAMAALGASPARMIAAVGPCIGPGSYEVGLDFLERFLDADPGNARFFAAGAAPAKRRFDLPAFVLERLAAAGVGAGEWIGCDSFAEEERCFSNRRAVHRGEADYGRLLSAIMLEPPA